MKNIFSPTKSNKKIAIIEFEYFHTPFFQGNKETNRKSETAHVFYSSGGCSQKIKKIK